VSSGGQAWYAGALRGSNSFAIGRGDDYDTNTDFYINSSGTATFNGTVYVASTIGHAGDTDNAIIFGTDTQEYYTGGVARLTIASTGVVSIGNASSTGLAKADMMLQVGGDGSNGKYNAIGFGYDGQTEVPAIIAYKGTSGAGSTKGELGFYTRNVTTNTAPTQRMVITDVGNIGISDASPSHKLSIRDNAFIHLGYQGTSASTETGRITTNSYDVENASYSLAEMSFLTESNGYTGQIQFRTNSVNSTNTRAGVRMTISSAGNVGIGQDIPTHMLDIYAGTQNASGGVHLTNDDSGGGATDGTTLFIEQNTTDFFIRNYEDAGIRIRTHDTDAMYIDDDQNVGIGTITPVDYHSQARNLVIYKNSNSGMTIASANNASGSIFFADSTTGDEAYKGRIEYSHGANKLYFGANSVIHTALDASGNFGIGITSSLDKKLHIASSTSADGITIENTSTGATQIRFEADSSALRGLIGVDDSNGNAFLSSTNGKAYVMCLRSEGEMHFGTNGNNTALQLDTSQNATFAGDITTSESLTVAKAYPHMINASCDFKGTSAENNVGFKTSSATTATVATTSDLFNGYTWVAPFNTTLRSIYVTSETAVTSCQFKVEVASTYSVYVNNSATTTTTYTKSLTTSATANVSCDLSISKGNAIRFSINPNSTAVDQFLLTFVFE